MHPKTTSEMSIRICVLSSPAPLSTLKGQTTLTIAELRTKDGCRSQAQGHYPNHHHRHRTLEETSQRPLRAPRRGLCPSDCDPPELMEMQAFGREDLAATADLCRKLQIFAEIRWKPQIGVHRHMSAPLSVAPDPGLQLQSLLQSEQNIICNCRDWRRLKGQQEHPNRKNLHTLFVVFWLGCTV